jgi:hypothetical protein
MKLRNELINEIKKWIKKWNIANIASENQVFQK